MLVAVAPVLSPQYLLWLAPLSALLAPRYPLQAVLLALACVLTRVELRFAFDDLPRFDWGAIALVALRNARAGGVRGRALERRYWASERKTDQAGLSLPFVNARPVWNPAANGLRASSSRIRNHTSMSMRGFARARATLRRSCSDCLARLTPWKPSGGLVCRPNSVIQRCSRLPGKACVEALDQPRQVGERDVVRIRDLARLLADVRAVRMVRVDVERRVLLAEQQQEPQRRDGGLERLGPGVVGLGRAAGDGLDHAGVRAGGVHAE